MAGGSIALGAGHQNPKFGIVSADFALITRYGVGAMDAMETDQKCGTAPHARRTTVLSGNTVFRAVPKSPE